MSKMTDAQFAGKIDWEGGIIGALDYGLSADDLENQDGELATAWRKIEELYRPVIELGVEIEGILEDIEYEDDEE